MRLAEWATPHVKDWHRQRHLNETEGRRHLESRNWTEAEKHLTLALAERDHSAARRLELLLDLAKTHHGQGKLAEAEQSARTAIEAAAGARNHSLHTRALDALVDLQLDQQKYAEAAKTVEEIGRLENAQSKPDAARLAQCARKLGTALLKSERPAEAMQAFQRSAQLSEQAFGAEHLETGNILAELGALHRQQGDHPEAQRCLRSALKIHRAAAPDSPQVTQDLYDLAASLEESGDLEGAMGEYERMLALKERQVGGSREDLAEVQVRLGALYVLDGRAGAARELLMNAIGVLERKKGPSLALALETLACADERVGRSEDAKRWREKALSLSE
jgi:tetratricopeptide (TPR) repeat protein